MLNIIKYFFYLQHSQRLVVLRDDLRGLRQEEPVPLRLRGTRGQRGRQGQGRRSEVRTLGCQSDMRGRRNPWVTNYEMGYSHSFAEARMDFLSPPQGL